MDTRNKIVMIAGLSCIMGSCTSDGLWNRLL